MKASTQQHPDNGFAIGLLMGTALGAGLIMWLVPRLATELYQRVTDSATSLGVQASEQYQRASTSVAETVDDLTGKLQDVRDDVADAVARSAHDVERMATAAKSDRTVS